MHLKQDYDGLYFITPQQMSGEPLACSFLDTKNVILHTSPTIISLYILNFLSLLEGLKPPKSRRLPKSYLCAFP